MSRYYEEPSTAETGPSVKGAAVLKVSIKCQTERVAAVGDKLTPSSELSELLITICILVIMYVYADSAKNWLSV